jgi:hypothetical protein
MLYATKFPWIRDERLRQELISRFTLIEKLIYGIYTITGTTPDIDPFDGHLQLWTLTANSTPSFDSFDNGGYITLQVDSSTYDITWPGGMKWLGGEEPTLDQTDTNIIVIWKADDTLFGSFAGVAS